MAGVGQSYCARIISVSTLATKRQRPALALRSFLRIALAIARGTNSLGRGSCLPWIT